MKNLIVIAGIAISLLAAFSVFAQSEGKIYYDVKVNMHRTIPPGNEEMKERVPEFNTVHDLLYFNANESYYFPLEEEEEDMSDGAMHVRFRRPMSEYYFNAPQLREISQRESFGKFYLIKDTIRISPWKLLSETKIVAGYLCKSAALSDTVRKQQIIAWYSDKIRTSLGPERFNTLPGTVLQVDLNNGERVITATKIEFIALKKGDIKIPSKGTQVTENEFTKIMEENRRRMGAQGGVIIRTN